MNAGRATASSNTRSRMNNLQRSQTRSIQQPLRESTSQEQVKNPFKSGEALEKFEIKLAKRQLES